MSQQIIVWQNYLECIAIVNLDCSDVWNSCSVELSLCKGSSIRVCEVSRNWSSVFQRYSNKAVDAIILQAIANC